MDFQYKELGNDVFAYQVIEDGERLGEITWTLLGDVMVMDHAYVSSKLRGQGIAKKLLDNYSSVSAIELHKLDNISDEERREKNKKS